MFVCFAATRVESRIGFFSLSLSLQQRVRHIQDGSHADSPLYNLSERKGNGVYFAGVPCDTQSKERGFAEMFEMQPPLNIYWFAMLKISVLHPLSAQLGALKSP